MSGVVWITGASTGLGRASALEFARRGWRVAATARSGDKLKSLEEEASGMLGDVTAFPGDVTDAARMAEVVIAIEEELGDALDTDEMVGTVRKKLNLNDIRNRIKPPRVDPTLYDLD